MKHIDIELENLTYPVLIDTGLLDNAVKHLAPFIRGGRLVVISDDQVWNALGQALSASLNAAGIETLPIILRSGEHHKNWENLINIIDKLLNIGIERSDYIVAFGGGVIGDITGLAAALVKRGCGYVQIPTTLLAQVDSSVGGKTAINVPAGKNLVGAFHQPAAVLIDPQVLATLPARHIRAGYAEIVKYALIGDAAFFDWCEANAAALLARDNEALLHAIETSIRAKAAIVGTDERETKGRRALLNLGHTFGHALEAEAGFSDTLLHGEAVAVGLALAFRFSVKQGLCKPEDAHRVTAHLRAAGLPTDMTEAGVNASGEHLTEHMAHDKKRSRGHLPFILANGIGKAFVAENIDISDVAKFLEQERPT